MKKMFTALIIMSGFLFVACQSGFCDVVSTQTVNWPTSAQNAFLDNQIIVTVINHGTFSEEYRSGQKQMILSDNIIEAGHYHSQYLFSLDGSLYQDPAKTGLDAEIGIRLNLHSLLNGLVNYTPQWQTILGNIELYPRLLWDSGQDNAHKWVATFNLGLGFGPGSGIPPQ